MSGETIMHIVGGLSIIGLIYAAWKQIPAEDIDIVEARKYWGKAK